MQIRATDIACIQVLIPRRFADRRGHFCETWNRDRLAEAGISVDFCQDNLSFSRPVGTVRGLHFQTPPFAQDKLISVLSGRILDVAVDLRDGAPTYGQHIVEELTAEGGEQLLIPKGFAHGFCTLEPDTTVFYKVSAPYARRTMAGCCGTTRIWQFAGRSMQPRPFFPKRIGICPGSGISRRRSNMANRAERMPDFGTR